MTESILNSTKKVLGLDEEYKVFDVDVIMHINSVLATLNELGVGPAEGFAIADETAEWADFLSADPRFNSAKSYVYLRVRLMFDPPTSGFATTAIKEQIKEMEWRLNVVREGESWTPPVSI